MARTKHQTVRKAAIASYAYHRGKKRRAKNIDLRQAASQGRAPVSNPSSAQPGFTGVPVSVVALTPGQGPPMSTPDSAGRGNSSRGKGKKRTNSRVSASLQAIQNLSSSSTVGGAPGNASPRARGRRKR